jgi:TonB family protein
VKAPLISAAFFVALAACCGVSQSAKPNYPVYKVGGHVRAPRPISTAVPAPPESINAALKVRVSFVVAPDGSVTSVRLLKRSDPNFDDFAIGVVSNWKFEPATKEGRPVAVRLEAEVRFHRP